MKFFQLFVDESGTSNPTHAPSPLYILCGCCIEKSKKTELREYANQIKFKYWGKTEVVWHSDSLRRNIDDFKIFRGEPRLRNDFLNDLFRFLNKCQAKVFVVVVDKARARARGWDQTKVVEESSATLVGHFTRVLLALNAKGKMFVESSDED